MSRGDHTTDPGPPPRGSRPDRTAPTGPRFTVAPGPVLRWGLPVVAVLAIASTIGRGLAGTRTDLDGALFYLVPLTDLDAEGGIPAWYSSMLLLACAAALWTVGGDVRGDLRDLRGDVRGVAGQSRWSRHWRLLGAGFVVLSLDEAVSLHEDVGFKLRETLALDGGLLHFSWVLVAIPLVVVVALLLIPFLRSLPRRTALAFLVSGVVYVGGAVGAEIVAAAVIAEVGRDSAAYLVASTLEEVAELLGLTLFLAAVADHRLRHVVPAVGERREVPAQRRATGAGDGPGDGPAAGRRADR